mmetsp:Transcript_34681/g.83832  ORF Transcript_34681/g.83832 Transcript_34681/m.83832 type:complete len:223 (-) Transcript_34681:117-785(-)
MLLLLLVFLRMLRQLLQRRIVVAIHVQNVPRAPFRFLGNVRQIAPSPHAVLIGAILQHRPDDGGHGRALLPSPALGNRSERGGIVPQELFEQSIDLGGRRAEVGGGVGIIASGGAGGVHVVVRPLVIVGVGDVVEVAVGGSHEAREGVVAAAAAAVPAYVAVGGFPATVVVAASAAVRTTFDVGGAGVEAYHLLLPRALRYLSPPDISLTDVGTNLRSALGG